MRRLLASTSLTFMLAAAPVWAQVGNPAAMSPGTPQTQPGTPAPNQPNQQDRLFVQQAGIGGMAEFPLGRVAGERAQNAALQGFWRRMVPGHRGGNDPPALLGRAAHIPVPQVLDP